MGLILSFGPLWWGFTHVNIDLSPPVLCILVWNILSNIGQVQVRVLRRRRLGRGTEIQWACPSLSHPGLIQPPVWCSCLVLFLQAALSLSVPFLALPWLRPWNLGCVSHPLYLVVGERDSTSTRENSDRNSKVHNSVSVANPPNNSCSCPPDLNPVRSQSIDLRDSRGNELTPPTTAL